MQIKNLLLLTIIFTISFGFLGLYTLKLRKRLKEQLQIASSELQHAHGINNARNLFLAGLSHELRTPLSGIIGAAQLFNQTTLNEQQTQYVRMINSASTVLLEIIDDMLTFSRINTGRIQLAETVFDMRKDLDDLLLIQSVRLQNRSVALVIDIEDSVPVAMMGDRGKLNQIMLNVIGNAIKYTQEGSITIEINSKPSASPEYKNIEITIADTGMGMDKKTLDEAFQPFSQSKKQYLDDIANSGMGLGLAICKRLVTAMDGNIEIQSVLGSGTSVTVTLPLKIANDIDINTEKLSVSSYLKNVINNDVYTGKQNDFVDKENIKSMVVLVIEDDEINRLVCTRYLATQGHHPIVVANHVQAKEILESGAYIPDVILMDINLVGMSGVQLAITLRKQADYVWQHIPIIFMSADVSGQAESNCKGIENSCFLEKPFSPQQLQLALGKTVHLDSVTNAVPNHISINDNNNYYKYSSDVTENLYSFASTDLSPVHSISNDLINIDFINQEIIDLGPDTVLEMLNIFRSNSVSLVQNMSKAVSVGDYSVASDLAHKLKGSAANLGLDRISFLSQEICDYLQQPDFVSRDNALTMVLEVGMLCHPSSDQVRGLLLHPLGHSPDHAQL